MIRYTKTQRSTQETIQEKIVSDNWWSVYYSAARMDGRRIRFSSSGDTMEIIYTEKDYAITLQRTF